MKSNKQINFLKKQNFDAKQLSYVLNPKKVYANLFEISLKNNLTLFQYPYKVNPPIGDTDTLIRDKLFKRSNKQLRTIFGDCFISGDSLYSMKEIKEIKIVKSTLFLNGRKEYDIKFDNFGNKKIIGPKEIQKDPLSKQFIEMIIRDILSANPKLDFYKDVFVMENNKKTIETKNVSISFYPGFTTSFMETDNGNYLNVTLKNKIIQNDSIYDYLNQYKYKKNKDLQKEIKTDLIDRPFKVCYAKRNYRINDILFEKTPQNTTINYEGETINLVKYYEKAHHLEIKDQNQPLILVIRKDSQGDPINLYFVPEFCFLSGLEDDTTKDGYFMKELAKYTKLEPIERINKTNEFLNLLSDKERDPKHPDRLSSKEKCDKYGIEVKPVENLFNAYYMEETKLIGGNKKPLNSNQRTFPVLKKKRYDKLDLLL